MGPKSVLALVVALLLLAAGGVIAYVNMTLDQPLAVDGDGYFVHVESGSSLAAVSRDLAVAGVLATPSHLKWYGRLTGRATQIKAGEYLVVPGTTPRALLEQLVSGDVYLHQLTILEGWRAEQMLAAVREHPAISATDVTLGILMAELGSPELHPEGQFFPDTYRFPRGTKDVALMAQAHAALKERLAAAWQQRQADLPLDSPYQALILASIVEKETALDSERSRIAGVFIRRLEKRMRLQTDPTVIYGLGASFDGNLRRRDLSQDTPYNTYTRLGLPPTPIALAGGQSLQAAVQPTHETALYFVATGAGDGSHYFSSSLEEHNQAVTRYLERLRDGKGRSP